MKQGHIHVKNFSACWLPRITLHRRIGGTIYSVTSTYEGTETLDSKLRRILEQSLEGEVRHP